MAHREPLRFENLEEAISYIDSLLEHGYEQVGKWNLAQCCEHLNHWITFPMDGFPNPGPLMGVVLWLMKSTVGKSMLKSILHNGFKEGTPTMPMTVAGSDVADDQAKFEQLKMSINKFNKFDGPIQASPLFGEMSKDIAIQLQLRHFEHHLSFLVTQS